MQREKARQWPSRSPSRSPRRTALEPRRLQPLHPQQLLRLLLRQRPQEDGASLGQLDCPLLTPLRRRRLRQRLRQQELCLQRKAPQRRPSTEQPLRQRRATQFSSAPSMAQMSKRHPPRRPPPLLPHQQLLARPPPQPPSISTSSPRSRQHQPQQRRRHQSLRVPRAPPGRQPAVPPVPTAQRASQLRPRPSRSRACLRRSLCLRRLPAPGPSPRSTRPTLCPRTAPTRPSTLVPCTPHRPLLGLA